MYGSGWTRGVVHVLSLAAGLAALACAGSDENTSKTGEALIGGTTCGVGQACALAMQFPAGINPDQLAVVGLDGVSVGSGSVVLGVNGDKGALVANTGQ